MTVVIQDFEATTALAEPTSAATPPPKRPPLPESQGVLRQLAARAARLRAH